MDGLDWVASSVVVWLHGLCLGAHDAWMQVGGRIEGGCCVAAMSGCMACVEGRWVTLRARMMLWFER